MKRGELEKLYKQAVEADAAYNRASSCQAKMSPDGLSILVIAEADEEGYRSEYAPDVSELTVSVWGPGKGYWAYTRHLANIVAQPENCMKGAKEDGATPAELQWLQRQLDHLRRWYSNEEECILDTSTEPSYIIGADCTMGWRPKHE